MIGLYLDILFLLYLLLVVLYILLVYTWLTCILLDTLLDMNHFGHLNCTFDILYLACLDILVTYVCCSHYYYSIGLFFGDTPGGWPPCLALWIRYAHHRRLGEVARCGDMAVQGGLPTLTVDTAWSQSLGAIVEANIGRGHPMGTPSAHVVHLRPSPVMSR